MLYIGPASALSGPGFKRGKPGNAAVMGLKQMTPRALAYVAVQVSKSCALLSAILSQSHLYNRLDLRSRQLKIGPMLTNMGLTTRASSGSWLSCSKEKKDRRYWNFTTSECYAAYYYGHLY
jgi:hypothetical protein